MNVPFSRDLKWKNSSLGRAPAQSLPALKQGDERLVNNLQANRASRREFMRLSGLAVGATALALPATGSGRRLAGPGPRSGRRARPAARGQQAVRERPARPPWAETGRLRGRWRRGRRPLAIIVGCADSRVSPELVFDQGVGDLFVVRVAGNIVSGAGPFVKGSIEFAVAELGARLIVVLGHEACGAVKAAVAHIDANDTLPGSIRDLVELIRPAAAAVRGKPGDKLENAIKANVAMGVERLKGLDPILSGLVKKGEVKVVGAVYKLRTGVVELLD